MISRKARDEVGRGTALHGGDDSVTVSRESETDLAVKGGSSSAANGTVVPTSPVERLQNNDARKSAEANGTRSGAAAGPSTTAASGAARSTFKPLGARLGLHDGRLHEPESEDVADNLMAHSVERSFKRSHAPPPTENPWSFGSHQAPAPRPSNQVSQQYHALERSAAPSLPQSQPITAAAPSAPPMWLYKDPHGNIQGLIS